MNILCPTLATLLSALCSGPAEPTLSPPPDGPTAPQLEVVFVLDTTGSMSGLIKSAKERIWSIASALATVQPTPEIRMGLVAYRDRGDRYITHVTQLDDDLDAVYRDLIGLAAKGGGDTPESVNQALHEAVTGTGWSEGDKVLKLIFLVGDAPPKMTYNDDVKFTETCRIATDQGVVINTIQCGNMTQTTRFWRQIAELGLGRMFQVSQSGQARSSEAPITAVQDRRLAEIARLLARHPATTTRHDAALAKLNRQLSRVASQPTPQDRALAEITAKIARIHQRPTPLDAPLAALAKRLDATRIWYGSAKEQASQRRRDADVERIQNTASIKAQAMRGHYNCTPAGRRNWAGIGKELIHDLAHGVIKLRDLRPSQLPADLRQLSPRELAEHVARKAAERKRLQARIRELTEKRTKLIAAWTSDLQAGQRQLVATRQASIAARHATLRAAWQQLNGKRAAVLATKRSAQGERQRQLLRERARLIVARQAYIAERARLATGAQSWADSVLEAVREQAQRLDISFQLPTTR